MKNEKLISSLVVYITSVNLVHLKIGEEEKEEKKTSNKIEL